jgi:hypothetical protein
MLVPAVVALVFFPPSAAAMSQATAISLFAILQVLGSVFFAWLAIRADKDFFLLLGNVVCAIGAVVWCFMLTDEEGNPTCVSVCVCVGLGAVAWQDVEDQMICCCCCFPLSCLLATHHSIMMVCTVAAV